MFAPDDTFAVVMDSSELTYTKVPLHDLDYLQQADIRFPTYEWAGPKPLPHCRGFIVDRDSEGSHTIVVATEEAGSIGFISVPSNAGRTDSHIESQAMSMVVPGIDKPANSVALIGNTSLVVATFGSTVAVW